MKTDGWSGFSKLFENQNNLDNKFDEDLAKAERLVEQAFNKHMEYKVGDYLACKEAEGVCDKIEWSTTFQTWCYHVTGKRFYWIYQTDPTLSGVATQTGVPARTFRGGRDAMKKPPMLLPDPISIPE